MTKHGLKRQVKLDVALDTNMNLNKYIKMINKWKSLNAFLVSI